MNEQQEIIAPVLEMTAGEMLKNARTTGRRKREISTIAKLLCIREDFLQALEDGNYRVIPEDVYILGFARSYAVELGLNPDEVIAKLKKELGIVKEEQEDAEEENVIVKKEPIKINKETLLNWYKISVNYVKKNWIWFASGAAALLLVIILSLVLFSGNKSADGNTDVKDAGSVAVAVVKEPDFRYPIHEKFESKNAKESRVVLQVEKESWVKIEDARGNIEFSRVLIPGDVYYMPNKNN